MSVKFNPKRWDEKELANRLAGIVSQGVVYDSDHKQQIPYKDSNGTWKLDSGNNWFFHYDKNECDLTYRYGQDQEFWSALKVVLDILL